MSPGPDNPRESGILPDFRRVARAFPEPDWTLSRRGVTVGNAALNRHRSTGGGPDEQRADLPSSA